MSLFSLTIKRLFSRKLLSILLIFSIGLSTLLLIGIQKIKNSAKSSFSNSISGTDLIVGSRSGDIQLLLYTVFRQGQPVANISWESIEDIKNLPEVDWVIPLSLGDSHRGFPVVGTDSTYFEHYRYSTKKQIQFHKGRPFQKTYDVVLGSEVAKTLNYSLNDVLYMSHGMAKGPLKTHKNNPFKVVGVLKPTHTPIDKTLHIKLEGMTALHVNWNTIDKTQIASMDLTPSSITGAMVGLHSKFALFTTQRKITNWVNEPLMAIIPGVTLSRLWSNISIFDNTLMIISILVLLVGFTGLLISLFMSLIQRKRELALLRTMGANPSFLFRLVSLEAFMICIAGVSFGIALIQLIGFLFKPFLESQFGLTLDLNTITSLDILLSVSIVGVGLAISSVPALLAYQKGKSHVLESL